jgi:opacity protein-like surface antigen
MSPDGQASRREMHVLEEDLVRKSLWICIISLLFAVVPAWQALAQYEEDKASPLSFKIGVYRPSGEALREGSSLWKIFGINYDFKMDELGRPTKYIGLERAAATEGRFEGSLTSAQYCQMWRKGDKPKGAYYGGGVGIFLASAKMQAGFDPDNIVWQPEREDSGTKLGLAFIGGYDLSENWFAEIRYQMIGEVGPDANFSGLALFVGGRGFF